MEKINEWLEQQRESPEETPVMCICLLLFLCYYYLFRQRKRWSGSRCCSVVHVVSIYNSDDWSLNDTDTAQHSFVLPPYAQVSDVEDKASPGQVPSGEGLGDTLRRFLAELDGDGTSKVSGGGAADQKPETSYHETK